MKTTSQVLQLTPNLSGIVDSHSENIVTLWALKCVLKLGGMKRFMNEGRIQYDDVAEFFGLDVWLENEEMFEEALNRFAPEGYTGRTETLTKKLVVESLEKLMGAMESAFLTTAPVLERNIAKLSNLLSLNPVEQDILRFVTYVKYYDILDEAARTIGEVNSEQLYKILSTLLSHPKDAIRLAFSPRGRLARTGMVTVDRHNNNSVRHKIDVASNGFIEKMMTCDEEDIEAMIKDSVRRCEKSSLGLQDYNHIETQVETMVQYLKKASAERMPGVNVLLYGRPGTGKTELVKTLAQEIGVELFEVSYADEDDDPIGGQQRLRAYRVAQTILQNKTALLMFDEIEDVFKDDDEGRGLYRSRKTNSKAWLNRVLENNPIPSIWITNKVYAIDNAFIRRFDMVFEIPVPPKTKRQEIISSHAGEMVEVETLKRVAQHENISPAIITRAAKVITAIGNDTQKSSETFETLINNTIKAQGWEGIDDKNGSSLPKSYDPTFVNTSMDLDKLLRGMRDTANARICFYGVPGTGKSAFGQYIAQELDKPFLLKKGSDLMSKWVGETEKNIARAFKEATEEKAVLVFDEVDSFLQDRRSANASWEVTQVNEMLVQMENYQGIFIATTNLMEGLDQASIRRFDLKLEFGYLKPEQAVKLFQKEAEGIGIKRIEKAVLNGVRSLTKLAPGDFAAVRRQSRFAPIKNAKEFYERLCNEISIKQQSSSKVMGFLR